MTDTTKHDADEATGSTETLDPTAEKQEGETEEAQKLALEVKIDKRGDCERHITVTVPREDIDRYFNKEFSEMMPEAHVPGFRPGHAPRKLVENRFRKDVAGRVKGALLVDSLQQIHEDYDLAAIGEPELDLASVEVPDDGPLTFEFDLEVRPQFDLPQWKGLTIEKPVRDFSDADIDEALKRLLTNRGRLEPFDGPADPGDYITVNLTFKDGDTVLSSASEEVIRLRSVLSFHDGKIEGFDLAMAGVKAGETRDVPLQISDDAPNPALRGKTVAGVFEVLEVKKLHLPEMTPDLLQELGGFELEADLRDAIKDSLVRKLDYQQRQRTREQVTSILTAGTNWELPHKLLERNTQRELTRAVLELQKSGYSDEEILAYENLLRQNSAASTARALKEHFILERIAEEQEIDAVEEDYDTEIAQIAQQRDESPRKVRARLEKAGAMDALRNQIIERKVIDMILEHAKFKEVPAKLEEDAVTALELAAGGREKSEIPEAKPGGEEPAEHLPGDRPLRG